MPAGSSASRPGGRHWLAAVPARVAACWRLKLLLAASISTVFCVPFIALEHFPLLPVWESPASALDGAIGFHPAGWIWVYQSVYLPMNLIPWLARERGELLRFVRGFALLAGVSFAIFIFFPTRVARPLVAEPVGMQWLLRCYDTPLNALPSLHAGLLVYALCFGRRIFPEGLPRGVGAFCVAWAILILYATLATKEHYLADLLAGSALGLLADAFAWRGHARVIELRPVAALDATVSREPLPAES